jgi:hypothetical protein
VTTPSLPVGLPSGKAGGTGGSTGAGGAGGSGGGTSSGANGGSGSASAQQGRTPQVYRLHLSRDWIAKRGTKRQRHTTIVFVLRNPSVVQFVLVRVSPDCHRVGRFRVVGRQGVNRVRIGSRIGRHRLRPGTYRLVARAVPGGRTVVDARLVVARRANRDAIEAARGADTCAPGAGGFGRATGGTGSTNGGAGSTGGPSASETAVSTKAKPAKHQGVLGAHFARKAVEAASHVPIWLYLLLALAIVLLAAAALPLRAAPSTGTASVLARHRGALAVAGAATLVAVMVAYVLL